ncbi:hypothetical protein H6P81_016470 [Aristolochia fimbriata]|uniref:Uncharacterized protein n=1 Tax=Aristolochia fimbriata TaxID=158543 RepID=A0AAV7E8E4_ARIFI|nr:hypothetical protein H6P81_016470 [Aristolochia fimbriata]
MHLASNFRPVSRLYQARYFLNFDWCFTPDVQKVEDCVISHQCQRTRSFSSAINHGFQTNSTIYVRELVYFREHPLFSMTSRACSTSIAKEVDETPTEAAKEVYHKMLKSLEGETMPPNALLWSLIDSCRNREDIKLLFQMLQSLRKFRLSNLRIHENFNSHLCQRVADACIRVGALDFGKKVLFKHNVYGITPTIASVHHLLSYAKEHNNAKLMVDIMKLLKKNDLPLQPGTADIVFSICSSTDSWGLISKYSKKFIKGGVKLRRTSFGTWMVFAARRGDVESLWKIEDLRSKTVKQHNLATGVSCAKGYLLECKPENAASVIHMLHEKLPTEKRPEILAEILKMIIEWPLEVLKCQKKEDRKALANSLRKDIQTVIGILMNEGLEVTVNQEDIIREEAIPA